MRLNQRFRSPEAAQAAIGKEVFRNGSRWRCVDHNDLGCLYWQVVGSDGKLKGSQIYDRNLDHRAGFPGADQ